MYAVVKEQLISNELVLLIIPIYVAIDTPTSLWLDENGRFFICNIPVGLIEYAALDIPISINTSLSTL